MEWPFTDPNSTLIEHFIVLHTDPENNAKDHCTDSHTSNSAGSQQVDDIYVVSQVNEDFQLRHQSLFLSGMSACCEGQKETRGYSHLHFISKWSGLLLTT